MRYILYDASLSPLGFISNSEFKFLDSCSTEASLPFLSFTTLKSLSTPDTLVLSPTGVLIYSIFLHFSNILELFVTLPTSHVQIFAFLISLSLNICCISVTFEVLNLSMSVKFPLK